MKHASGHAGSPKGSAAMRIEACGEGRFYGGDKDQQRTALLTEGSRTRSGSRFKLLRRCSAGPWWLHRLRQRSRAAGPLR